MASRPLRLGRSLCVAAATLAVCPALAGAAPAAGITAQNTLVTFDTSAPGAAQSRPIAGLASAAGEVAVGVDTRPATGELFLWTVPLGSSSAAILRTYRLDVPTATAAFVGSIPGTVPGLGERPTGVDFQPLVDRVRIVQSNDENARVNPTNGALAGDDPNLTYTAPATGPISALAYDRNVAPGPPGTPAEPGSRTTLYGIDVGSDRLVTQGGVDGSAPGGPNGGAIASVGPLGLVVDDTSDAGFDIAANGTAFAALRTGGSSALYTIDLATGQATPAGGFTQDVRSLALVDNCPGVAGDDQGDLDGDLRGDACDDDVDGDGVPNAVEQATGADPRSADSDGDGRPDGADACPTLAAATLNGCPEAASPADATPPTITLSRTPRRITRKRFLAGLSPRIAVGEASSLSVTLLGRARSAGLARAGDLVLAERNLPLSPATRTVKLKPNRRLVGRGKAFKVRLRVIATDAAGNRRTTTRAIRVRG
jgi:Domain of unknown function (DUF4394)/Thrombospondin type 3 repeat